MSTYLFATAIPALAWLYALTCRLFQPHARLLSLPHPLRQRHHGKRIRPTGRHEILPGLMEVAA